jgi:hypothetical protein
VRSSALLLLPGLLTLGATAASAAKPDKADKGPPDAEADVTAVKDKLKLLTDGKKHYVAVVPFGPSEHFYYGDGKSFYAQRVFGSSSSGTESFDFTFWEPRVKAAWQASFQFKDSKYEMLCEDRKTELKPVPDAESKELLAAAKFFTPRWKHQGHALARDDRGVYYFVDKVRDPKSKVYRLYSGPKGAMKPLKMTNVVSDSEGEIFATPAGELRLVLDRSQTAWIKGKKRTQLINLPVEDNHVLIYTDLGVYTGQRLGTPCDDL